MISCRRQGNAFPAEIDPYTDMLNALKNIDYPDQRARWLQAGWAFFGALLFGVTWRLWTGHGDFPQVPLLAVGHLIPRSLDSVGFIVILLSLVATLICTLLPRNADSQGRVTWLPLAIFCPLLIVVVIANQHRLQPWAYLAWLTAIVLVCCRGDRAVLLLRLLVISIYLHSAISKLDHQFLATLGPSFLNICRDFIGIAADSGARDQALALFFPLTELLLGVGLWFQRTRRLAVLGAVIMHLVLICLLSPWGLRHEFAVLIWNAYFIWQAVVLFGGWNSKRVALPHQSSSGDWQDPSTAKRTLAKTFATAVIGLAVLLPLLEPIGWFDHWPAWGLYAPRNSRCSLYVNEDAVDQLPGSWNWELVDSFDEQLGWSSGREVQLPRESLRRLHVPIYPQDRFQLGVALAIARHAGIGDVVHVVWESASARMTGERERETFHGVHEIEAAAKRFWLNVEPRS